MASIISRKDFKNKLNSAPAKDIFYHALADNLSRILWDKPWNSFSDVRKKRLQKALLEDESVPVIQEMLPECKPLFDWIISPDFVNHKGLATNVNANIMDVFEARKDELTDKNDLLNNPEKLNEFIQNFRNEFRCKIANHISRNDFDYFFKFVGIRAAADKGNIINVTLMSPTPHND